MIIKRKKMITINKKQIMLVAYICMAVASTAYAVNASAGMKNSCSKCTSERPVHFANDGTGASYNATNQADCCTTACMIVNPGNSDGAGSCASDCLS
jgi:hypothetical protein